MPGWVLLAVAIGFLVALWVIWIHPPAGARKTSALAHTIGGILAGWALVEALRRRISHGRAVTVLALLGVFFLTVLWELGEYVGDRMLDTTLIPSKRNSAEDIFIGVFGGAVGITFASVVAFLRRES